MHWALLAISCATILAGIKVGEAIPVVLGIAGIIIGLWLGAKGDCIKISQVSKSRVN